MTSTEIPIPEGGLLELSLKYLTVQMPDGSEWALPMNAIISHKARKTGGSLEDVIELFRRKEWYAVDWVTEHMTWEDFDGQEIEIKPPPRHFIKLSEADWANGIVDIPETLC